MAHTEIDKVEPGQEGDLNEEERHILHLFRSMKQALSGDRPEAQTPVTQSLALTDHRHTLLLMPSNEEGQLQVGFIDLSRPDHVGYVVNNVDEQEKIDVLLEVTARFTEGRDIMKTVPEKDQSLTSYVSEQFTRARDTHNRAVEAIKRHDETERKASAVSQRTKELLDAYGK